ncbi:MAG TPA: CpaF family protein [Blastocatellia bacterium]|nr:CpaF family protein [Blastocatellia bacterium]
MATLRERLEKEQITALQRHATVNSNEFQELKARVHSKVIRKMDLAKLEKIQDQAVLQKEVRNFIERILTEENAPLSALDRERLQVEVLYELRGLGPLEPLLQDKTISDILVNGYRNVYVERRGRLERADVMFRDDEHLKQIIERIVSRVGRRIDESSPMVDARLSDGSRVNAIIPPLALDGPVLSIRRFGVDTLQISDLIKFNTLTPQLAEILQACVRARLNVLISGGTGAGKTTMLNALSAAIPEEERLVTIEDSAELRLQQEHVVRLETRAPNIEGRGEITQRQLLRNALRMRPDRIIVGEVRGDEALDMLQAMNTGHDGGMTTIHANSPRDALSRLETMISMAGLRLSDKAMRQQITSAINLVIQVSRLSDGSRKITSVSEITGMEGEVISMQDIYVFQRTGVGENGAVLGRFRATGIRPRFSERLQLYGHHLSSELFADNW